MTELNFSREVFLKKKKEALTPLDRKTYLTGSTKVNSFRENFKKRETKVKAELEKIGRILKELGERFKWWQSLP